MSGSAPGRREVAYRVFAAEFDDAEFAYSESDEERAPNYVVTPTGARVNRLFAVGVLTEVDDVNPEMVRGRVVDPTGAFVSYAGQYQPDALAFLERADPPTFVALSGKARTFEPDDADVIYSSVRPESVNAVDADTRDRWVVTAAERTLDRIGVIAAAIEAELTGDELRAALAEAGVDDRLADGVALALEYYDTSPSYLGALRETALSAVRVVADERSEAVRLGVPPADAGGPEATTAADLATLDLAGLPTTPVDTAGDEAGDGAATTTDDGESIDVTESQEPAETTAAGASSEPGPTATGAEPAAVDGTDADAAETPDTGPGLEAAETVDAATATDDPVTATATDDGGTTTPSDDSDTTTPTDDPDTTTPTDDPDVESSEPGEFDPGEFEMDEETRQSVEEEYGTEFSTADEVASADVEGRAPDADVDESGTAGGTDAPGAGEAGGAGDDTADESATGASDGTGEDTATVGTADDGTADDGTAPVEANDDDGGSAGAADLEEAVMEAMETVGDEGGAEREAIVAAVVEAHGADPAAVEAAIEDALMSGRCYEPAEGTLKAI
jgi:RPA family protein